MSTLAERTQGTAFAILYAKPALTDPAQMASADKHASDKEKDRLRARARRAKTTVDPLEKVRRQVERDNTQRSNWTLT